MWPKAASVGGAERVADLEAVELAVGGEPVGGEVAAVWADGARAAVVVEREPGRPARGGGGAAQLASASRFGAQVGDERVEAPGDDGQDAGLDPAAAFAWGEPGVGELASTADAGGEAEQQCAEREVWPVARRQVLQAPPGAGVALETAELGGGEAAEWCQDSRRDGRELSGAVVARPDGDAQEAQLGDRVLVVSHERLDLRDGLLGGRGAPWPRDRLAPLSPHLRRCRCRPASRGRARSR